MLFLALGRASGKKNSSGPSLTSDRHDPMNRSRPWVVVLLYLHFESCVGWLGLGARGGGWSCPAWVGTKFVNGARKKSSWPLKFDGWSLYFYNYKTRYSTL